MKTKFTFLIAALVCSTLITFGQPTITITCPLEDPVTTEGSSLLSCSCDNSFLHTQFVNDHLEDLVPQGEQTLKIKTNVIFVQDATGENMFDTSNPDHMDFWNKVFIDANFKLKNLLQESCSCSVNPTHFTDIKIELIPSYIEIQSDHYWNHRNDPDPLHASTSVNSFDKPYLNEIVALAEQVPGYEHGFNVVITTDGTFYDTYVNNNPQNLPLWTLGYNSQTSFYAGHWYSAFPTCTLSHKAVWHAPDEYLIYLNGLAHVAPYGNEFLETDHIPGVAGLFIHEYGHYFKLTHRSCTNNIMNPAGAASHTSLNGCQVREMYLTLMRRNLRQYVVCENVLDHQLIVDGTETWDYDTKVYGDILIKDGASLIVTCKVHLSPNARIVVERGGLLELDGGQLTGNCEDRWKGIIVEGDVPGIQANSGKVILKNSSIVENAIDGISMYPEHIAWDNGNQVNYYGGLVEAESSTIRNCNRAVAFMKYGTEGIKDASWFNDVNFEDLTWGVTIWANDGVTFKNCNFSNILNSGIYSYDSEAIVNTDNVFEDMPIGIDILTTYPIIFSSKIGDITSTSNKFHSDIGINVQSTGNIEPLKIFNNEFSLGNKGVRQNGISLVNIQRNKFDGLHKAIEVFELGNNYNLIESNEINDSYIGSHSIKTNLGLRYFDNCFESSYLMDIAVTVGGIFPFQGSTIRGAGNCFTKNQISEIYNTSPNSITYFVKSGISTSSCRYPQNLYNVFLNPNALEHNDLTCGSVIEPIIGTPDLCNINSGHSISQLKQIRLSFIQAKASATSNSYESKDYEQCIEVIESLIGQKMLDPLSTDIDAGKENAVTFFTSSGMDFKDSTTAYGIMVNFGELSRASNFLNSMDPTNTEESNFIIVQNHNLDYLVSPSDYEVTLTTKNQLYAIGTSDGPFNGYARSLFEVLTGERIEVEIPVEWRSNTDEIVGENKLEIRIAPNPSKISELGLSIRGTKGNPYHVQIINALGIFTSELLIDTDGEYRFANNEMVDGIYFVTIKDSDKKSVYQSKVLIFE